MLRITILFGKTAASLVERAKLGQIGFRKSLRNQDEWNLPVADVTVATSHFEATNEVLSRHYPFSLAATCPDAVNWIDLHWRLEMCIGCFAVIEVTERERMLFRQIWLESDDDAIMIARSRIT